MEQFIFGLVFTACVVAVASEWDCVDNGMLGSSNGWKEVEDANVWVNSRYTCHVVGQPSSINDAHCGTVPAGDSDRIWGGEFTEVSEYPWTVSLQGCGGSLINEMYVLTAAHCLGGKNHLLRMIISIGDHHLGTDQEVEHEERKVAAVKIHSKFDPTTDNYDIALVKLDSPVALGDHIGTVCLPTEQQDYLGEKAVVAGWGWSEDGNVSAVLRDVTVTVFSNEKCKNDYKPHRVTDKMLCAGTEEGGKDSCKADSGGPLMVKSCRNWTQIGIVSWGYGCGAARYPGVYVRVTEFVNWIKRHIQD